MSEKEILNRLATLERHTETLSYALSTKLSLIELLQAETSRDLRRAKLKIINKPVTERINDFNDVLFESSLTLEDFEKQCLGLELDEINYKKIKLLVKALNEGWTPDWNNSKEYKYYPYFRVLSGGVASTGASAGLGLSHSYNVPALANTYFGSRLCFKNSELAIHAGSKFIELYSDFLL